MYPTVDNFDGRGSNGGLPGHPRRASTSQRLGLTAHGAGYRPTRTRGYHPRTPVALVVPRDHVGSPDTGYHLATSPDPSKPQPPQGISAIGYWTTAETSPHTSL